jgi:hypothetical protein
MSASDQLFDEFSDESSEADWEIQRSFSYPNLKDLACIETCEEIPDPDYEEKEFEKSFISQTKDDLDLKPNFYSSLKSEIKDLNHAKRGFDEIFHPSILIFMKILRKWEKKLNGKIFFCLCGKASRRCSKFVSHLEATSSLTVELSPTGLDKLHPVVAELFDDRFTSLAGHYKSLKHFNCDLHRFNCLLSRAQARTGDYWGSSLHWKFEFENGDIFCNLRWMGDNVMWDDDLPDTMGTIRFDLPIRMIFPEELPQEMKDEVNEILSSSPFTVDWSLPCYLQD